MTTKKITVEEALNEYYSLKNKYETTYFKKYIAPILKSTPDLGQQTELISKLPKHACVYCKRPVGSIFESILDKDNFIQILSAKCGDNVKPCPFNIVIHYAIRYQTQSYIKLCLKKLQEIKVEIIKEKNNSLFFGTTQESMVIFEQLIKELKLYTQLCSSAIETNILKTRNPAKLQELDKLIVEFQDYYVVPFKQMIKEYIETMDYNKLREATTFYIDDIETETNNIQLLQYPINYVTYDRLTNQYNLIQNTTTINDNLFWNEEDDQVIQFIA